MSRYVLGTELSESARADALARFVNRMTFENNRLRPHVIRHALESGYKLRLLTDAEWLACTRFSVRKNGQLSNSERYCETSHPDWRPSRSPAAFDHAHASTAADKQVTP